MALKPVVEVEAERGEIFLSFKSIYLYFAFTTLFFVCFERHAMNLSNCRLTHYIYHSWPFDLSHKLSSIVVNWLICEMTDFTSEDHLDLMADSSTCLQEGKSRAAVAPVYAEAYCICKIKPLQISQTSVPLASIWIVTTFPTSINWPFVIPVCCRLFLNYSHSWLL